MSNNVNLAEQLRRSLDDFLKGIEYPMFVAVQMNDENIVSQIKELSMDCIIKIDHKINIYLEKNYNLKKIE